MAALTTTTPLASGVAAAAIAGASPIRTPTPLLRPFSSAPFRTAVGGGGGGGGGTGARRIAVRLSPRPNPRGDEGGADGDDERGRPSLLDSEDMGYLWKLVVGSILSAVVIKYGSLVFPEITKPNLVQALLMIMTPVVVSIVLLFSRSNFNSQS